ncbi:hypothetical protein BJ165DRAFT_1533374 [Panaeolus papilionaceus]|nr:hypothetical protein BJ165DRAFT_1533374 [Panaeolus papilionaceus]
MIPLNFRGSGRQVENIQGALPQVFSSGSRKSPDLTAQPTAKANNNISPSIDSKKSEDGTTGSAPPAYASFVPSTERPDVQNATHPSDHNPVRLTNKSIVTPQGRDIGQYRFRRMKKYDKVLKRRRKIQEREQKKAAKKATGNVGGRNQKKCSDPINLAWSLVFLAPIPLV